MRSAYRDRSSTERPGGRKDPLVDNAVREQLALVAGVGVVLDLLLIGGRRRRWAAV